LDDVFCRWPRRKVKLLLKRARRNHRVSDAEIDRIIDTVGPERVPLAAIDEPAAPAQAAE
jgi:hypothetical protein